MKNNYQAWNINENDFPQKNNLKEQIFFLLKYAVLAPSAHNTQPWSFEIIEDGVKFLIDKNRALGYSDKSKRQTYESLGACLENFLLAAEYFDFNFSIDYKENGEVMVFLKRKEKSKISTLKKQMFKNITKRYSAKLHYLKDEISPEILQLFLDLNDFPELNLNFYNKKSDIKELSNLVKEGTESAFLDKNFCEELSMWVRSSWTKEYDGMPAQTMGIPNILTGIISWAIKNLPLSRMQSKLAYETSLSTPVIGLISGKNNKKNWILAGRLYERLALLITDMGLNSSIMGAAVETEITSNKLKIFINSSDSPLLFFRLGKQNKKAFFSPRHMVQNRIAK